MFHFKQHIFKQKQGLAMGSRLSPILSTLVLDDLERQTIFSNNFLSPLFYARYVDDTLVLVNSIDHANNLLQSLNSHHTSLKFTLEYPEKDGYTAFLDIKIRTENNALDYKLYQKAAKKDMFVHFHSALPTAMKQNVAGNELLRALKLSSNNANNKQSTDIVTLKLERNAYPRKTIHKLREKAKRSITQAEKHKHDHFSFIKFPFISDNFNKKVRQIIHKIDASTKIINTGNPSLRSILNKHSTM